MKINPQIAMNIKKGLFVVINRIHQREDEQIAVINLVSFAAVTQRSPERRSFLIYDAAPFSQKYTAHKLRGFSVWPGFYCGGFEEVSLFTQQAKIVQFLANYITAFLNN